jgi:gluconate 2-dehydrogenase gamma chain
MTNEPVPRPNFSAKASKAFSRRTLLKLAALGTAGAAVGAGSSAIVTRLGKGRPRLYRFFSDAEAALLIDICEQIIPRDDAPGATDAGVIRYIDRQLAGPLARHQPAYRRGLEAFHLTCLAEHQSPFAHLPAEQKVEVLKRVESGKAAPECWREPTPAARDFFRLVLGHTMQGFYGPARHGGNRDHVSYRMLGLDYPQLIGQNRRGNA